MTTAGVPFDLCCCADAAKFQQLAEEARKQKLARRHARKERTRPAAAKPQDEAVIRLAQCRAKVMKQERELIRTKAEQQKAEMAAKRKLLLQREKAARQGSPNACDPDEGNATTLAHSKALCVQDYPAPYKLHACNCLLQSVCDLVCQPASIPTQQWLFRQESLTISVISPTKEHLAVLNSTACRA